MNDNGFTVPTITDEELARIHLELEHVVAKPVLEGRKRLDIRKISLTEKAYEEPLVAAGGGGA